MGLPIPVSRAVSIVRDSLAFVARRVLSIHQVAVTHHRLAESWQYISVEHPICPLYGVQLHIASLMY